MPYSNDTSEAIAAHGEETYLHENSICSAVKCLSKLNRVGNTSLTETNAFVHIKDSIHEKGEMKL